MHVEIEPAADARSITPTLTPSSTQPTALLVLPIMCDFTKNYYIYTSCIDPGAHFFRTSTDGSHKRSCVKGPHERYIVVPGACPLCGG
ncbi:hypothetical protein HYQ44_005124 [Verticillium longisporum]|nr:hypothetical protein HYQ44_005124 [Verticillium longisporum]